MSKYTKVITRESIKSKRFLEPTTLLVWLKRHAEVSMNEVTVTFDEETDTYVIGYNNGSQEFAIETIVARVAERGFA